MNEEKDDYEALRASGGFIVGPDRARLRSHVSQDPTPRILPDVEEQKGWSMEKIRRHVWEWGSRILREDEGRKDRLLEEERDLEKRMAKRVAEMEEQERQRRDLVRKIEIFPDHENLLRCDIGKIEEGHRRVLDIYTVLKHRCEALEAFLTQYTATREIPGGGAEDDGPTETQKAQALRVVKILCQPPGTNAFPDYASMERRLDLDASSDEAPSGLAVRKGAQRAAKALSGRWPASAPKCWQILLDAYG